MMTTGPDHSSIKAAETITLLQHFMKDAPREFGLNWSAFVVLATLASADVAYLSSAELIERTGMNRGWAYRNIRLLLHKGLITSVKQRGTRNQVRALYSVNGRALFWLQQSFKPNGIALIKAFERT
jgi:DNA-binding MarR family transcriptional regulator